MRLQSLDQRLHVRPVRALDMIDRSFSFSGPAAGMVGAVFQRMGAFSIPVRFSSWTGSSLSQFSILIKMKRYRGLKKS